MGVPLINSKPSPGYSTAAIPEVNHDDFQAVFPCH